MRDFSAAAAQRALVDGKGAASAGDAAALGGGTTSGPVAQQRKGCLAAKGAALSRVNDAALRHFRQLPRERCAEDVDERLAETVTAMERLLRQSRPGVVKWRATFFDYHSPHFSAHSVHQQTVSAWRQPCF